MRTIAISIILLSFISISACGKADQTQQKATNTPRLVKAITLKEDFVARTRSYPARVSASQKVDLSFQVPGRLIQLPFWEGEDVKKGDLLAALDPKDYQIRVNQQKAKYDLAKITYERYEKLLPSNAISVAQYDEKKSIYDLEKANLAEVEKALADTKIYAPFDGVVANRYVENHQYIQAKEPILSLQDISDIELIIFVPEQDVTNAEDIEQLENEKGKQQVGVAEFASIPNQQFPVYVKQVQTEADPSTQSYKITLIMPRPEQKIILPGMTAKVLMGIKQSDNLIKVPQSAVAIDAEGKNFVWLIDPKTNQVAKQTVNITNLKGDTVTVTSGLKYGDTIVTAGVDYLQPGMKVKIQTGRIGH